MADIISDNMDREWRRWRDMCSVLKTRGIDINADDVLAESIRTWGDSLVALRDEQGTAAIVTTDQPGTPREDGRGIDAPPAVITEGKLQGVRLAIHLYRDDSVGIELVTDTRMFGVPKYERAETVRAALRGEPCPA